MEREQMIGKQSILFHNAVHILSGASMVGKKEGDGPLGKYFDKIGEEDGLFGCQSWEEAESILQKEAVSMAIKKVGLSKEEIRMIYAGDLLAQTIASSFGIIGFEIPVYGLYGACATMGEALSLASMAVAGGYGDYVVAVTSSHFGSAEKEFRFPLGYGNQRPFSATWTVTGSGACVLGRKGGKARITGITTGKIIDYGLKDSLNMGACMAPAASDTIYQNLEDFGRKPEDYDRIITGDLGEVGKEILIDLLKEKGYDVTAKLMDCGIEIYDKETQDTHAGGSGCGCSATTFASYILPKIEKGEWKDELMDYLNAFWVGGLICALVQILLDRTKLLPGRVMVLLVCTGTVLGALGIYEKLIDFAGAGASVPLLGFGNTLWKGIKKAVDEQGLLGIFQGGFESSAVGISAALIFGYLASLIFKPKMKK